MYGIDTLRNIMALQFYLFGGVPEEDFYANKHIESLRPEPEHDEGEVIGYIEYNLDTGELTIHDNRQSYPR